MPRIVWGVTILFNFCSNTRNTFLFYLFLVMILFQFIILYTYWNMWKIQWDYGLKIKFFLIHWQKINLQAWDIYKKETQKRNHCCHGKAIIITYSECMSVTLVTQHAMLMRRTILSFVVFLDLPYFSILSQKGYDFRKIVNEHKMCTLIFSITWVWNILHSKKNSARYCYKRTYIFK